jgi:hypothetical protein
MSFLLTSAEKLRGTDLSVNGFLKKICRLFQGGRPTIAPCPGSFQENCCQENCLTAHKMVLRCPQSIRANGTIMKEIQIVRTFIRFLGLVGLMYVCRHWYAYAHKHGSLLGDHRWELFFEVLLVLLGIYMTLGAPLLLNLIVPKDDDDKDDVR